MPIKGGVVNRFSIASVSSVALVFQCTWSDNLWRFRWDNAGRRHYSGAAFPGDHGFRTFEGAAIAAGGLGFRPGNIVPDPCSIGAHGLTLRDRLRGNGNGTAAS